MSGGEPRELGGHREQPAPVGKSLSSLALLRIFRAWYRAVLKRWTFVRFVCSEILSRSPGEEGLHPHCLRPGWAVPTPTLLLGTTPCNLLQVLCVPLCVLTSLLLFVKRRRQKNMERKMLVLLKHRYISRTIFLNVLCVYKCTNMTAVTWGEMTGI